MVTRNGSSGLSYCATLRERAAAQYKPVLCRRRMPVTRLFGQDHRKGDRARLGGLPGARRPAGNRPRYRQESPLETSNRLQSNPTGRGVPITQQCAHLIVFDRTLHGLDNTVRLPGAGRSRASRRLAPSALIRAAPQLNFTLLCNRHLCSVAFIALIKFEQRK